MLAPDPRRAPDVVLGRYALHEQIAAGGMACVYLARLLGPVGFSRTVAIKRLHPQFAADPEFAQMFLDEARLAARVRHPNVIPTLDVVARDGEIFHVMEYVHGQTLAQLARAAARRGQGVPPVVAANVLMGALHGLHAAHEANDEQGAPLRIVHRDVSPQNIFVGADGVARVIDFGVAKAIGRLQSTSEGQLKGKLGYMAPEQVRGHEVGPETDVFGASVVLWELLAGRRLFIADSQPALLLKVLEGVTPNLAGLAPHAPPALIAIVHKGLARERRKRFRTAREMALALEQAVGLISAAAIGEWVEGVAPEELSGRARMVSLAEIAVVSASGPGVVTAPAPVDDSPTIEDDDSTTSPLGSQNSRPPVITDPSTVDVPADRLRAPESPFVPDRSSAGVAASLGVKELASRPSNGGRWLVVGLVAATLAVVVTVAARRATRSEPSAPSIAVATAPAPLPAPSAPPEPPSAAPEEPAAAEPAESAAAAEPSASANPSPAVVTSAGHATPRTGRPAKAPPRESLYGMH